MEHNRSSRIKMTCPFCSRNTEIAIDWGDFLNYQSGVFLVQDAFPSPFYTPGERETLKTGLCPECQKNIFGGEEEN